MPEIDDDDAIRLAIKYYEMREGIVERHYDRVQPFAVYYQGRIVWFARTMIEAMKKLEETRIRRR